MEVIRHSDTATDRVRRPAGSKIFVAAAVAAAVLATVLIVRHRASVQPAAGRGRPAGVLAYYSRDPAGNTALRSFDVAAATDRGTLADRGVTAAQWSPDGSKIAYTLEEDEGAAYALVVANANGSAPTRLVEHRKGDPTLPGPDFVAVAWSPDGRQLAYSGRTMSRGRTVSVLNADGSGERVLDGLWMSVDWSPDGHLLVAGWPDARSQERVDLYRATPDEDGFVRLTDDVMPEASGSWSPDGTRIAFAKPESTAEDANVDVYVMDADGSDVRRLTHEMWFEGVPVWSPDGAWIAFASNRDETGPPTSVAHSASIYVMRPDGSGVERILDGRGGAVLPATWKK